MFSPFLLMWVLRNCAGGITFSFPEDSRKSVSRLLTFYKGAVHCTLSRVSPLTRPRRGKWGACISNSCLPLQVSTEKLEGSPSFPVPSTAVVRWFQ